MKTQDCEPRSRPLIPSRLLMAGAAWLLLSGGLAQAADAENGRVVAEQWCGVCHAETAAETGQDMEASFEELVARPGRDANRLRALMDEDHFPMTTFRLFAEEKDDVVAYLVDLKPQQMEPVAADGLVEKGRALVETNCAVCHAIGMDDDSPMEAARPLRDIANAYDPEFLAEPLAEGIVTAHPFMPEFIFEPDEIDAIIEYLIELRDR